MIARRGFRPCGLFGIKSASGPALLTYFSILAKSTAHLIMRVVCLGCFSRRMYSFFCSAGFFRRTRAAKRREAASLALGCVSPNRRASARRYRVSTELGLRFIGIEFRTPKASEA